MMGRPIRVLVVLAVLVGLAGCTSGDPGPAPEGCESILQLLDGFEEARDDAIEEASSPDGPGGETITAAEREEIDYLENMLDHFIAGQADSDCIGRG